MPKILPYHEVASLAVRISIQLGFEGLVAEKLLREMCRERSLPQHIKNCGTLLWVDKFYIAYSKDSEPDVHYVYITKAHIAEEHVSYKIARKERNNNVHLPKSISNQFSEALKQMQNTGRNYVVFEIG